MTRPTLADVVAYEPLALTPIVLGAGLDREVRWVHTSDVLDPTPWLQGGELLLTTGLRLKGPETMRAFVDRLADRDIAGIGFGVGPGEGARYDEVPREILAAARRRGLPVLAVPLETPYVAIAEFVSGLIAADQYQTIQRAFDAQRLLTAAALEESGQTRVLEHLARLVNGWAVVTTAAGTPLESSPSGSVVAGILGADDRARIKSTRIALSITGPAGETIMAHPLGGADRVRRILIVGRDAAFDESDRIIIAGAVTLLSIETERRLALSPERRIAQTYLGTSALAADTPTAKRSELLAQLGMTTSHPVRTVDLHLPGKTSDWVMEAVHDVFAELDIPVFCVPSGSPSSYTAVVQERTDVTRARLAHLVDLFGRDVASVGVSRATRTTKLDHAQRQSLLSLRACRTRGVPLLEFDDLNSYELLLGLMPAEALADVESVLLAPLDRLQGSAGQSHVRALQAYLKANGQLERAALDLGIHRQTLVKRLKTVEELLGLDLGSPDARTGLWLALTARELLAGARGR